MSAEYRRKRRRVKRAVEIQEKEILLDVKCEEIPRTIPRLQNLSDGRSTTEAVHQSGSCIPSPPTPPPSEVSVLDKPSGSCACCLVNNAAIKSLVKTIEELKVEVKHLSQVILQFHQTAAVEPLEAGNLPLKSFEDMKKIDESLGNTEDFSKLVKFLGSLGGRDSADCIRRILTHLISHELALHCNWIGGEKKKSIQECPKILQLVTASVRHNGPFERTTQADVDDAVKRWLRSASDRNGGRNKRKLSTLMKC